MSSGQRKRGGGGEWQLTDFCNWGAIPEDEPASIGEVFGLLKAMATPRKT